MATLKTASLLRCWSFWKLPRCTLTRSLCTHSGTRPSFSSQHLARTLSSVTFQTGGALARQSMSTAASSACVVYVTVPDQPVAKQLGHGLVTSQLAACVNVIPGLQSIYLWEGKVNEDAELLLMIKTKAGLVNRLTEYVKANHPYDECEVISVPITGGSKSYIEWVQSSTLDLSSTDAHA